MAISLHDAITILLPMEDIIGKTYHLHIPVKYLERVFTSWQMIMNHRPLMQIRDPKGSNTMFVESFVLSVNIADKQQAHWLMMLMELPGVQTHQA